MLGGRGVMWKYEGKGGRKRERKKGIGVGDTKDEQIKGGRWGGMNG